MIVNIRKSDGAVVDKGQHYDERFFENRELPDGEIPDFRNTKVYVLDKADDTIKEQPRSAAIQTAFVMLMNGQPHGRMHAHPNDQLIVVLAGEALVLEDTKPTSVWPFTSYLIPKGVSHVISGAADHTLILTVQV